jgi:hypothetical protein
MENGRPGAGELDATRAKEQDHDDGALREDCTLAFQGRLNLRDDEAGSDPYNRTGRFRRIVR